MRIMVSTTQGLSVTEVIAADADDQEIYCTVMSGDHIALKLSIETTDENYKRNAMNQLLTQGYADLSHYYCKMSI